MKLKRVFARFYKSFNFDSLRKAHPDFQPWPWDSFRDESYPYVTITLDPEITTVVGANESGKSHLLSAIKKGITGKDFSQRDLCRYSPFFNVEVGKECWPHVGLEWDDLSNAEAAKLREIITDAPSGVTRFLMFRLTPNQLDLYFPAGDGYDVRHLQDNAASTFGQDFLPQPFEIKSDVALPGSVPLDWLADPTNIRKGLASRRVRSHALDAVYQVGLGFPKTKESFSQSAASFFERLSPLFGPLGELALADENIDQSSLNLARDLLVRLANVDPDRLKDLTEAIADGADGHANALVTGINDQLAKKLNFPKWWVQDRDFSLRVTPREMDLVFTIRDRTGTEYTFSERSSGLKYFLSYLIQARSRARSKDRQEILLMDEPDAYLSAEAQQDLLKIFDDFARPEADVAPIQVVFVTHSPFLIDKNHADRIRVLEKGNGLAGTRVIRNVSQNHYEPLRSAFGAFVGETAFIGACNLLVEGTADQILLSGAARLTRLDKSASDRETLDLNRLVIVPCGSANHVPYMLYLIRGRDADKPPVIALLDSDEEGTNAANLMRKEDPKMRRLIRREFVFQIGDIDLPSDSSLKASEMEDLIPEPLALAAANSFLAELSQFRESSAVSLNAQELTLERQTTPSLYDALNAAAVKHGMHLDKIGFARAVIHQCKNRSRDNNSLDSEVEHFLLRMRRIFSAINQRRRSAERDSLRERVGTLVERLQRGFLRDHPNQATKEQALSCLEDIQTTLDDSNEADAVRLKINNLKREFKLDETLNESVEDYPNFAQKLTALKDEYAISRVDPNG